MKRLLLSLVLIPAILLASLSTSEDRVQTYRASVIPPVEYQGPVTAEVNFASPDDVNRSCWAGLGKEPPKDEILWACAKRGGIIGAGWILAPNPCLYAERERFAKIMCHEQGHLNGWRHD